MIAISLQTAEPSFLPHDFAFKLLNLALKGQKESQRVQEPPDKRNGEDPKSESSFLLRVLTVHS